MVYRKSNPKGVKLRRINLKCCNPKGIKITVTHNTAPSSKCEMAIINPPSNNHKIFKIMYNAVYECFVGIISLPNGATAATAILNVWIPKGIPIIVKQSARELNKYSKKMRKPPKMNHMILPSIFKFSCPFPQAICRNSQFVPGSF